MPQFHQNQCQSGATEEIITAVGAETLPIIASARVGGVIEFSDDQGEIYCPSISLPHDASLLSWCPTETCLSVGLSNGSVYNVYLLASGEQPNIVEEHSLSLHKSSINLLKWSPDGGYLVVADTEGVLSVSKPSSLIQPLSLLCSYRKTNEITNVVFLSYRGADALGSSSTVSKPPESSSRGQMMLPLLDEEGLSFLASTASGLVFYADETGNSADLFPTIQSRIDALGFDIPSGKGMAIARDGTIARFIIFPDGQVVKSPNSQAGFKTNAFAKLSVNAGPYLCTACPEEPFIRIWNLPADKYFQSNNTMGGRTFSKTAEVHTLSYNASSGTLVAGLDTGHIHAWRFRAVDSSINSAASSSAVISTSESGDSGASGDPSIPKSTNESSELKESKESKELLSSDRNIEHVKVTPLVPLFSLGSASASRQLTVSSPTTAATAKQSLLLSALLVSNVVIACTPMNCLSALSAPICAFQTGARTVCVESRPGAAGLVMAATARHAEILSQTTQSQVNDSVPLSKRSPFTATIGVSEDILRALAIGPDCVLLCSASKAYVYDMEKLAKVALTSTNRSTPIYSQPTSSFPLQNLRNLVPVGGGAALALSPALPGSLILIDLTTGGAAAAVRLPPSAGNALMLSIQSARGPTQAAVLCESGELLIYSLPTTHDSKSDSEKGKEGRELFLVEKGRAGAPLSLDSRLLAGLGVRAPVLESRAHTPYAPRTIEQLRLSPSGKQLALLGRRADGRAVLSVLRVTGNVWSEHVFHGVAVPLSVEWDSSPEGEGILSVLVEQGSSSPSPSTSLETDTKGDESPSDSTSETEVLHFFCPPFEIGSDGIDYSAIADLFSNSSSQTPSTPSKPPKSQNNVRTGGLVSLTPTVPPSPLHEFAGSAAPFSFFVLPPSTSISAPSGSVPAASAAAELQGLSAVSMRDLRGSESAGPVVRRSLLELAVGSVIGSEELSTQALGVLAAQGFQTGGANERSASRTLFSQLAPLAVATGRPKLAEQLIRHSGNAMASAVLRARAREQIPAANTALAAVQLSMPQEALKLFSSLPSSHSHLLVEFLEKSGQSERALQAASAGPPAALRALMFQRGRAAEASGDLLAAERAYALAGARGDMVRMYASLGADSVVPDGYGGSISTAAALTRVVDAEGDRKERARVQAWLGKYMESQGLVADARSRYTASEDVVSLSRLSANAGDLDAADKVVRSAMQRLESLKSQEVDLDESGTFLHEAPAAAYQLARIMEASGDLTRAQEHYCLAGSYGNAVRVAKERGSLEDVFKLAAKSDRVTMLDVAGMLVQRGDVARAVPLYLRAGASERALELCFTHSLMEELEKALEYLGLLSSTSTLSSAAASGAGDVQQQAGVTRRVDHALLTRSAEFFRQNGEPGKAVRLLVASGDHVAAAELCVSSGTPLTEPLADELTPPVPDVGDPEARERRRLLLLFLASSAKKQGQFLVASKKYTQAGERLQAFKCLLRSGDAEKIIFFAQHARSKEVYLLAAEFLEARSGWTQDAAAFQTIVDFYSRARAHEQLGKLFEKCAAVEIDEFRNYEKALGALRESSKWSSRVTDETVRAQRLTDLTARIAVVERFVLARKLARSDTQQMIQICEQLIETRGTEHAIRIGDVFGLLVYFFAQQKGKDQAAGMRRALQLVEAMRKRRIPVDPYVELRVVQQVYAANGVEMPATLSEPHGGKEDD